MFQQKQIIWVLWRGTNLSKHDTGQERPLTVIMMCRLVLDGGPWWPHQEGTSKAPLPWQRSDGCMAGGGAGKMEVRKLEVSRTRRVVYGSVGAPNNSKYPQMQHISSRCGTWDNIGMHDDAFCWTGHHWNKIKGLCGEFSKPTYLWWPAMMCSLCGTDWW